MSPAALYPHMPQFWQLVVIKTRIFMLILVIISKLIDSL